MDWEPGEEIRIYDTNTVDMIRLQEVDLHVRVRSTDDQIGPLPGVEIMADQGDEYTTITLDMDGVTKLRRALQRLEAKAKRQVVKS